MYGPQGSYYGEPAAPQAAYSPQPVYPGYGPQAAPPGYYAPPQAYYGQPPYGQAPIGYYPPVYTQPVANHTFSSIASVLWTLCLLRNIGMLVVAVAGAAFISAFGMPFGGLVVLLVILPLLGIIGCALGIASDSSRHGHAMGTVGGVLAIVGSSFPGLLFGFGVIGVTLAVLGLAMHLAAKKEFQTA